MCSSRWGSLPRLLLLFVLIARTNDHQGYPQKGLGQLRDVVAGAIGRVDPYPHDAPGGRVAERLLRGDPARRSGRALAVAAQAEPAHDRDHGDGKDDEEADHVRWLTPTAVP